MFEVLVVDDSTLMREHIVASLRPLTELSFRHAANGLAALELLVQATFCLAVLDLDMPDLGGPELSHVTVAVKNGTARLTATSPPAGARCTPCAWPGAWPACAAWRRS